MQPLQAGQELQCKKTADLIPEDKQLLNRLNIDRNTSIFVTYIDQSGTSVRINRSPGNLEVFFPKAGITNWNSFFKAIPNRINNAYKGSNHYQHSIKHSI